MFELQGVMLNIFYYSSNMFLLYSSPWLTYTVRSVWCSEFSLPTASNNTSIKIIPFFSIRFHHSFIIISIFATLHIYQWRFRRSFTSIEYSLIARSKSRGTDLQCLELDCMLRDKGDKRSHSASLKACRIYKPWDHPNQLRVLEPLASM